MKKIIFPVLWMLVFTTGMAQTGDWDTYLARYEKGPGSTLVNLALKLKAPDSTYPFLFAAGVKFKNCSADGLPAPTAFITLNKISDSIVALISRQSIFILTGTFSYQCERKDYFYVKDTTGLKTAVTHMIAARFPGYVPAFLVKEDRYWDAYLHFLYPNEDILTFMYNQRMVMRLEKSGDKTELPRPVDHFLHFRTEKDRECFIYKAIGQKFSIVSKDSSNHHTTPFSLRITRTDKADLATINKLTLWVKNEAQTCKGEYDGWETTTRKTQ